MSDYQEQIKKAIIERITFTKRIHQRDIKMAVDEIKNKYLLESKITLDELTKITSYFKDHWHDLKEQARALRHNTGASGFAQFQA